VQHWQFLQGGRKRLESLPDQQAVLRVGAGEINTITTNP
jgi:hypothetical protein